MSAASGALASLAAVAGLLSSGPLGASGPSGASDALGPSGLLGALSPLGTVAGSVGTSASALPAPLAAGPARDALLVFAYALGTAVATGLGALPFLLVRDLSTRLLATANAVAAGLMLGASFGLLAEGAHVGGWQTAVGALAGVAVILVTQRLLGEHEPEVGELQGAGARRVLLFLVVMTVHSFAEGVAVGVSFGGGASLATAITLAIAVHNVPEGLAITAVMRPRGASILACVGWSVFSSLPQPLMAVPAFLFVERFRVALPYGLGFAAGAMVYMVLVELLPEAYEEGSAPRVALTTGLTLAAMLLFQRYV